MNILNIHHLCFHLEEIGIIDQNSLNPFLSLYSFVINKNKENAKTNILTELSPTIYENILCAYLKKIFTIEKNFKIFSNKIVNKFKQIFMVKQYNGLILLFAILSKKISFFKIQSFYKLLYKKSEINCTNINTNNNFINNKSINNNNSFNINNNNNEEKSQLNSVRDNYLKSLRNNKNKNKAEFFNKSFDFIINNTTPSINSKNTSNDISFNNKNIQLEFQKKQFLSKIKREHSVKFKRETSKNNKKLKSNNSNKNFESILLKNFTSRFNNINDNCNNKEIDIIRTDYSNKRNNNTYYNNIKLKITNDEESISNYKFDILRGAFSTKSENINFNFSPSCKNINTAYNNYKFGNQINVGYIKKVNDKNNIKSDSFRTNMTKNNNLNINDIHRIKQNLEYLQYYNLSP